MRLRSRPLTKALYPSSMRYNFPHLLPDGFPDVAKAGRGAFYSLYKREIEEIASRRGDAPRLLLHSCCGPCSTAVITRLAQAFRVAVFYYNPNIDTATEYERRAEAQRHVIEAFNGGANGAGNYPVYYIEETYDSAPFCDAARGLEAEREGGARCDVCFALRLERAAQKAREICADYFCTTLTASPMKDAAAVNRAGFDAGKALGVKWLWSDFKKEDGYALSLRISRELGLYRQNYCGCAFSKMETRDESRLIKQIDARQGLL